MHNALWYYNGTIDSTPTLAVTVTTEYISHLTKATEYELWHQCLGHLGNTIMTQMHCHMTDIPKLHGNHFINVPHVSIVRSNVEPLINIKTSQQCLLR